ncbi:MAG: hypothetical protein IJ958_09255 [Agathobacter sp.]|nr:hypothetical protein [Agathobacter sp.]
MKKVIIATFVVIFSLLLGDYLIYYKGVLYIPNTQEVTYFSKAEGDMLYIDKGNGFEEFEIRGVNLGLGKPGHYATESAITKEEYLRWFQYIQDMGANVIRVYTLGPTQFYEAFYEYNIDNQEPLYLIHGVWVDDYLINSTYTAFDEEFYDPFLEDCKIIVDVIHGRHKEVAESGFFNDYYNKDISQWVYGYILGIEWETALVSYTDIAGGQLQQYDGEFLYTEGASNFEIFLAQVGDQTVSYETEKYGTQRMLAFSNWATTDPLDHNDVVEFYFQKAARVDVEHIKCKDEFKTGQFASYHIYPYYPNYYSQLMVHEENTYLEYLTDINEHHSIPVVITEFGVPSSRGQAAIEEGLGRNQGKMSETEQGEALVSMYEDIMAAGSNGGIVFTWQDEWFKRTWNTMANINLNATAFWSDYQTNEQYFGILAFDPGEKESICYVDGKVDDWIEEERLVEQGDTTLYMKYDEKYIYFMIKQDGFRIDTDKLYIPIDVTPKSGSKRAENLGISMSREADFVIEISGKEDSRLWVQERYDTLSALFYEEISSNNFFSKEFPAADSSNFTNIYLLLQKDTYFEKADLYSESSELDREITFEEYDSRNPYHYDVMLYYETGLLTYGNANPNADNFNSLADFCAGEGCVEVKIPWQLLNFADPTNMYIHDDYYENYGVEYLKIDSMFVGAGTGFKTIEMEEFKLEPLGKKPSYHERLKESYYILQDYWTK